MWNTSFWKLILSGLCAPRKQVLLTLFCNMSKDPKILLNGIIYTEYWYSWVITSIFFQSSLVKSGSTWSLRTHLGAMSMESLHIGDGKESSHKAKRWEIEFSQLKIGMEKYVNWFNVDPWQPLCRIVVIPFWYLN